jgi:crotonobetainyl-CoA:carnitine CoA-transferase CaiB-like acyl-CoA transferase
MTALNGIRVIDLTMWFQGPVAGQHLADFGAEVIKVERPQGGDLGRGVRSIKAVPVGDWNQYFLVINRNKKSLALDLNTDEGREVMYKLAAEADVFLTNLTSENLEKWQVTYDKLHEINPRLVYAMCSGFGPMTKSTRPSFDLTVQALTGIMTRLGEPGQPPIYLGMGSGDAMGGLMAAYGIMVALHARRKTGKGQFLDASLYGAQLFLAAPTLQPYLATREELYSKQQSRKNAPNPLWNTYRCADSLTQFASGERPSPDGRGESKDEWLFVCMASNQDSWAKLTGALDAPDLAADPRFATPEARAENNAALIEALDTIFAKQTRDYWLRRFAESLPSPSGRGMSGAAGLGEGVTAAPINNLADLAEDPQAWANNYFTKTHCDEVNREVTVRGLPITLSKTPGAVRTLGPELGQHTEEILTETLGYTWEQVGELKEAGAIL